jgi:hypothetical protein
VKGIGLGLGLGHDATIFFHSATTTTKAGLGDIDRRALCALCTVRLTVLK